MARDYLAIPAASVSVEPRACFLKIATHLQCFAKLIEGKYYWDGTTYKDMDTQRFV